MLMFICIKQHLSKFEEVRNSEVTKSNYETELHKMTSHFELLTEKFSQKVFFRVANSTS